LNTDWAGLTRLSDPVISNKDMARQTLQTSSVASYLHDNPALFRNDRLAEDVQKDLAPLPSTFL
jgi:hypothetical protein